MNRLLLATWWIMALTALAILLEDGGPVLFRQERVGHFGRSFQVLKFRSMRTDAERDGIARWAQANDTRITRVGRFIRKTRIDELPQLLNVLRRPKTRRYQRAPSPNRTTRTVSRMICRSSRRELFFT